MKKLLSLILCLVLVLTAVPVTASAEQVTINVYNWGQYISDGTDGYIDVNKAFTEATGIEVNYMTFDSNETMYTKLKTGGSTYDVIIPSDYMVARLIAEDMLEELDYSNIPNYALVDEAYKNTSFDPENKYSVPYTWGTVGVIYNTKYVDEADIGSWDLLWNEKYSGKILMFDNPRDAFAIAQLLLGIALLVLRRLQKMIVERGFLVELFLHGVQLVFQLLLFLLQGAVLLLQLDGVIERARRRGAQLRDRAFGAVRLQNQRQQHAVRSEIERKIALSRERDMAAVKVNER